MPSFNRTQAQRRADRANSGRSGGGKTPLILGFKDPMTRCIILWEDLMHTAVQYEQHYDKPRNKYGPCAIQSGGFDSCVFCEVPADESITDAQERRDDIGGWATRTTSTKFVFPVWSEKGYIDLHQIGWKFAQAMQSKWTLLGTLTASPGVFTREGTFNTTAYDWMPVPSTPEFGVDRVPTLPQFRQLYLEVAEDLRLLDAYEGMPIPDEIAARQSAAEERWRSGTEALGVPNIGAILMQQYNEALVVFGRTPEEQQAISEANAAANQGTRDLLHTARAQGAPSSTERYVPPTPTADSGNPQSSQIQELCLALTQWGVPYPADAGVEQLVMLYNSFAPSHGAPPITSGQPVATPEPEPAQTPEQILAGELAAMGVTPPAGATLDQLNQLKAMFVPTVQQPAAPAAADPTPAAPAPAQEAPAAPGPTAQPVAATPQATPPSPASTAEKQQAAGLRNPAGFEGEEWTEGVPHFEEWDTPIVRNWLSADPPVEFPAKAPRSELLKLARTAWFGY